MESGKMGARRAMAEVESALADRAPHAAARRASPLNGIRRGAIGLALALAASLLVLYGLARLGAIGTNTSQIAQSNAALAIAVWQGDGGTLQAVASPQGGLAIYRNAQRIAWVRGHSAAIVSAAFVDNGRAVLTLDANGQSRLTRLGTAPALAAFEVAPALKALNQGLWRPYGAPVARAVQAKRDLSVIQIKLGDVAVQSGDLTGAIARFEASLAIAAKLARDNPASAEAQRDLSVIQIKLGDVAVQAGDLEGAQKLFERVLEASTRILGPEHPDTLRAMGNLASTVQARGDLEGALQLFEQVLAVATRRFGGEDPLSKTASERVARIRGEINKRPKR